MGASDIVASNLKAEQKLGYLDIGESMTTADGAVRIERVASVGGDRRYFVYRGGKQVTIGVDHGDRYFTLAEAGAVFASQNRKFLKSHEVYKALELGTHVLVQIHAEDEDLDTKVIVVPRSVFEEWETSQGGPVPSSLYAYLSKDAMLPVTRWVSFNDEERTWAAGRGE